VRLSKTIKKSKMENNEIQVQKDLTATKLDPAVAEMSIGFDPQCLQKKTSIFYDKRTYIAEFAGTMLFVLFGNGIIAQAMLYENKSNPYAFINIGYALGLTCALMVSSSISGGHLNPAITISNAIFGKFEWSRVPGYILAQNFGAFIGSALVYMVYWPAINFVYERSHGIADKVITAGIFATYPSTSSPNYNSFIIETFMSALFMFCTKGMTDSRYNFSSHVKSLGIGLSLGVISLSLGSLTQFSLNPARDFAPRIFTLLAGWGTETFTSNGYYFWIPIVGPTVGICLGHAIYDQLMHPDSTEE